LAGRCSAPPTALRRPTNARELAATAPRTSVVVRERKRQPAGWEPPGLTSTGLHLAVRTVGAAVVIAVEGELDLQTVPQLVDAVAPPRPPISRSLSNSHG
jgi:hypothetical protein